MISYGDRRKLQKWDTVRDHLEKSREFCEEVAAIAEKAKGETAESLKAAVVRFREQLHHVDCDLAP